METLNILFVGVQAYVPFHETKLEVYMPNATQMGISPQKPSLAMHMPTVWLVDSEGALRHADKLRHFPWSKLTFIFDGRPLDPDVTAIDQAAQPATDRMKVKASLFSDPLRLSGQVTLKHGRMYVPQPPVLANCPLQDWSGDDPGYPSGSIVGGVAAEISGITGATLEFESLLNPAGEEPESVTLESHHLTDHTLVIGNPCAESAMRWYSNSRSVATSFIDEDFWWLYQLVDSPPTGHPTPVFEGRKTPIYDDYTPAQVLNKINLGGGGGFGCECMGCIANEVP